MEEQAKYPNIHNSRPMDCVSGNIMKCNRIIGNIFRKYMKSFDITDSQLSMLFVITKVGLIKQKGVADRLHMEKSTVNRNLKRLMNKNYIAFDDNRFLYTTEVGKEFLEMVIPYWDKAMKEMHEKLEEDGLAAIFLITKRLIK